MKIVIYNFKYLLITFIILCFNSHLAQNKTVIIDELVINDDLYLYKGVAFTGLAFYKAKTGQFIAEVPFENGKMHGKRICYNYRGKVLSKDKFKKGIGKMKIYYSNDHLKNEGVVENGKMHGKRICYNYRGKVLSKDKFKKGIGKMKIYYSNDHLKNEGVVNNGRKEGVWSYYNKNGVIKAEECWGKKGEEILLWEKYFNKLGLLESELIYKNGSLAEERYYNEEGEIFKTNNYIDNK